MVELQKPEFLEIGEILPSPWRAVTPLRPFVATGAAWINTILGENEGEMLVNKGSKPCVSKKEDKDLTGKR